MNEIERLEARARPVLACLGDPSRFRLVRELAVAELCVGELAKAVGLSQSCTTRHLQALERVGLVEGRRLGRRVRFRLSADAPGLSSLLEWALAGGEPAPALPDGRRSRRGSSGARGSEGREGPGTGAGPLESETAVPPSPPTRDADAARAGGGSSAMRRTGDLEDYLL